MKYLLNKNNLKMLKSFCSNKSVLFAFDFDGTLAKIVKDPNDVKMDNKILSLILKLKRKFSVAVISGRKLSDLKKVLPFKPDYVVGNHGLEGIDAFKSLRNRARKLCDRWKTILNRNLSKEQGVRIENKGFSTSAHYRLSKNRSYSKKEILKVCKTLDGKHRLVMGKMVVDIIPSFAPNKGDAIIGLINKAEFKKVFYIGDDQTDEDVFKLPNKYKIFKVRVGESSKSSADFFIRSIEEIPKLLSKIIYVGDKKLIR